MTQQRLQQILSELFGEAAGAVKVLAQTDRGPVWAFSLTGDFHFQSAWGEGALGVWNRLREALEEAELWPLMAFPKDPEEAVRFYARSHASNIDYTKYDSRAALAEGLAMSLDDWQRWREEAAVRADAWWQAHLASPEYQAALQYVIESGGFEEDDLGDADQSADYPDDDEDLPQAQDDPQVLAARQSRVPEPRVPEPAWFLLVPARHSWEVPATLSFGAWNACPSPQEHVTAMHGWHQRYGAQLVGLSLDRLAFSVARPPQTYEDALSLARQHRYYCSEGNEDIPIEVQAMGLVGRAAWGFWWD